MQQEENWQAFQQTPVQRSHFLDRRTFLILYTQSPLNATFCAVRIQHKAASAPLKASVVGLFISALFHGLFDYFNFSSEWRVLSALLILLIWIWLIKLTAKLQRQERAKKVEI
ncbi:MAG: hypothetical protein AB1756_02430 [Acidobacteriota bacterium]